MDRFRDRIGVPTVVSPESAIVYFPPSIALGNFFLNTNQDTGVLEVKPTSAPTQPNPSFIARPVSINVDVSGIYLLDSAETGGRVVLKDLLNTLLDIPIFSVNTVEMPLRTLLSAALGRITGVEASVTDISGVRIPAVVSSIAGVQTSLANYALTADVVSSISAIDFAPYALAADLATVSSSVVNISGEISTINAALPTFALSADLSALSTNVDNLISTSAVLDASTAAAAAAAAAADAKAAAAEAAIALNELNDAAAFTTLSTLGAVVTDLSGNIYPRIVALEGAPGFDSAALEAAIADLSGNRVAGLEITVPILAQNLSNTDGNLAALSSTVAGKVDQTTFNDATTNIFGQLDTHSTVLGQKANAADVDAKGIRSKNVVYIYDPSIWSGDALTNGTPQAAAGMQAEAGQLVAVKTESYDNPTSNAVHLSSVTPVEGDIRRFINIGPSVLRIKANDGTVVAELVANEAAAIMWVNGAWVLHNGF